MQSKTIYVICGHTMRDSFCGALLEAYTQGAESSGATVRTVYVADLDFDPVLWRGYREIQALEEDLLRTQEDIRWAEHLVIGFPVWWGSPPAVFKGFIDRVFHPTFAFKYATPGSLFQDKLLAGRSARVMCTLDAPPWYYRCVIGAPATKMIKNSVLRFCGVRPVRTSLFGSVRFSKPEKRERWLKRARMLGERQR